MEVQLVGMNSFVPVELSLKADLIFLRKHLFCVFCFVF